jgi:hypothetical protein
MRVTLELILGNNGEKLWTELNKVTTGPVVITDTLKDGNFLQAQIFLIFLMNVLHSYEVCTLRTLSII